jgi:two-component system response regulator YesN
MDYDLVERTDPRVARAMRFVLRDLSVRHARSVVACAASVEPTYFSRLFRDVSGVSFRLWNMSIRVDVAQRLLRTTRRQVQEIAAAVGYTDPTTFERVFRKVTGMSPSAYRASDKTRNTQNAENQTLNADRVLQAST